MTFEPRPSEHIKIVISQKGTGRYAWASAKWSSLKSFGWLEEFQTYQQHAAEASENGLIQMTRARKPRAVGGVVITIGKGSDHHRPGPNNRRRFHVASNCSKFDLAELFHFTKGDWDWMTTKAGKPWTREEWNAAYQAGRF